jgi:tetratricopeptide (TPR) repeat protein
VLAAHGSPEGEGSASRALELCRLPGTDWKDRWFALRGLLLTDIMRPNLRRADEIVAEMVVLSEQHANAAHLAQALEMRALVNLTAGAFEPAAVDFEQAFAIFDWTPSVGQETLLDDADVSTLNALTQSAWNQCYLGYLDQALARIDSAVIQRTDARQHEAEVYRRKGELLLAQDSSNVAPAEQCFRTAIEVARKQRARLWELRATTSLARLLRGTNRRDEARATLAEIYNWFTEGFDTADLKDAKALLEELAA